MGGKRDVEGEMKSHLRRETIIGISLYKDASSVLSSPGPVL